MSSLSLAKNHHHPQRHYHHPHHHHHPPSRRGVINEGPPNSSIDEMSWDHAGDGLENTALLNSSEREEEDEENLTGSTIGATPVAAGGMLHDYSNRSTQYFEAVHQARIILNRLEEAENIIRETILPFNEESDDSCGLLGYLPCFYCGRLNFNIPKFITKNICIFSIVLQTLNLITLTLVEVYPGKDKKKTMILGSVFMIFFQFLHLALVILTSVELARKLLAQCGNGFLLCQSYISTILLFSGVYTVTFHLNPKGWKFINEDINDPEQVIELWSKFLFLSVSSGTLCGSSNFLPKIWYNNLLVSIQMLLSFIYFASILGQTVRPRPRLLPVRLATNNGLHHQRRDSCSSHISQSSQQHIIHGFLSSHKMFQEKDLIRLLFMCVCLCLVSQAYPCGTNPLKVAQKLADAKGITVDELLSNNDFRQKLNSLYQKYAKCISIVETGQFKRSSSSSSSSSSLRSRAQILNPNDVVDDDSAAAAAATELESPNDNQSAAAAEIQRRSDSFYKRAMLLNPRRLRNYSGEHFYFY